MISDDLKDCLPIMELLMKIKRPKLRQDFLCDQFKQNPKIYKAVHEIVTNLVHKNIPLDTSTKQRLRRHKRNIVDLVHDKNKKRHRTHLIQSGGYLHYIIPAVLSLLSTLLKDGGGKESVQT